MTNNTFNQYLKSKNRNFTLSELVTEYQEWLQSQGFYSPWIDAYNDVIDSLRNIELAGIVWTFRY